MRVLNFQDGFSSSVAPIAGLVTATSMSVYANDAAFVTAKGSAATQGDMYYNTSLFALRVYDGTNWQSISPKLISAADDATFVTLKGSSAVAGDSYLNTTYGEMKFFDGTNWQFSDGSTIETTSFTIANNQVLAANVTGLAFDGTKQRSAKVRYFVYRNTTGAGATELMEEGWLNIGYKTVSNIWSLSQISDGPDDAGVTFGILNGQVTYTSTNITGTAAASIMKFDAKTLPV